MDVGNLESCGDSLSVTVMVNPVCTETEYPVLVTFGARAIGSDMCERQENATLMLISPGHSATYSVDRNTVTLRDNEEYCYIVSINGEACELTACTHNIYSIIACTYHNVMYIHHECGYLHKNPWHASCLNSYSSVHIGMSKSSYVLEHNAFAAFVHIAHKNYKAKNPEVRMLY